MSKGILGRKLGMTQIFGEHGQVIPVTVLEAGPCVVVQKKTREKDGYDSIQLGWGEVSSHKINKPKQGHFQRWGVKPRRYLREFRIEEPEAYASGQEVKADIFAPGEKVSVMGRSRGKGFAGTIRRYGHGRGPKTHGSQSYRATGSLASPRDGSRVWPGRKMPGRMGGTRVTAQNLEVVRVDAERNLLLVKGSVPGATGALVTIQSAAR